ncbi:hypothetical protein LEMLEM_LOCUS15770 [Lemmus lemmus]
MKTVLRLTSTVLLLPFRNREKLQQTKGTCRNTASNLSYFQSFA